MLCNVVWAVILIQSAAATTNTGGRAKRQTWIQGNWGTLLPSPIAYEPEILSRLSEETCDCIEASLCPEFLKLLPYRSTYAEQFRRVTCGFRGFHPMVCCNQICERAFMEASPTPYHAPAVYYNVPDEKAQSDDPYVPATSERNYYAKRFSQDSSPHQSGNGFVTSRTMDVYPEYIVKTHDVSAQMYPDTRHKPYHPRHYWDNKPLHSYYPKNDYHPVFTHPDVDKGHFPPPDHSLPKYPFHPVSHPPSVDDTKVNPSQHNVTNNLHPKLNDSFFQNNPPSYDSSMISTTPTNHNLNEFSHDEDAPSNSTPARTERRKLLPTVECGVAPGERILGGKSAVLGEYPWIARIGYTRNGSGSDALLFRCAGSLINSRYVVTAAHCVTNLPTGLHLARVRLGELDERTDPDCSQLECADPVQDYLPKEVRVHEQYNTPRFRHDLALIRLDRPVTYTSYISPICLPFDSLSSKSYVGLKSDTAGWGATDLGTTSSSPVLQWVRVTVISNDECARVFADRTGTRLGVGQICAGGERGRDSCEGDSGGPLMRGEQLGPEDYTRYYLLGLVSFGAKRCGAENLPGVYTDVTVYLDWILDNIEA